MSINVDQIVKADYGNIVAKANPTGLLPTWNKWIDQAQASKLGFKYNIAGAKALLAANGYKDTNGDGYVENKAGQSVNLRLIVPDGWSDWMTAIQIIAASAKDAGIKITPAYPDYNGLVDERNSGKFDLVINNDKQLGPTPYTYYDYLFHLPVADTQTFANYSRFTSAGPKPWALTLALNKVNPRTRRRRRRSTRRSRSSSSRICLRSRSGTTACGRSTTPRTGRTSRPRTACSTRRASGTDTST